MFTLGGGLLALMVLGLWFWLDDQMERKFDRQEARPDPEADAEFEKTMADIESGK